MITYIYIDGFKSFSDFEMYFSPLTVVAGVNASGKSNLFDAMQFLSILSQGEKIASAMRGSRGEDDELFLQYHDGSRTEAMTFIVDMLIPPHVVDEWGMEGYIKFTRLRYELQIKRSLENARQYKIAYENLTPILRKDDVWLNSYPKKIIDKICPKIDKARMRSFLETTNDVDEVKIVVHGEKSGSKKREYSMKETYCTILSRFTKIEDAHLMAARQEMAKWMFLQLEPKALRMPTHKSEDGHGLLPNGCRLANVVFDLKVDDPYNLTVIGRMVNRFMPNLIAVDVFDDKENMRYVLRMQDKNGRWYSSRVLSEGTLRVLALCVLAVDNRHQGPLCFEEPENGVHPQRIAKMAELVAELSADFYSEHPILRQAIVNTHSPLFVQAVDEMSCHDTQIYLSRMVSAVGNSATKRLKFAKTRISPYIKNGKKTLLSYSEQELKLSAHDIMDYLINNEVE